MTNNFEVRLKNQIELTLCDGRHRSMTYRVRQGRFTSQHCDIKIDSGNPLLYSAIECKQMSRRQFPRLYFSSHMRLSQITQMSRILQASGRRGWLVLRHKRCQYYIPWCIVTNYANRGEKYIPVHETYKYWAPTVHPLFSGSFNRFQHWITSGFELFPGMN